MGRIRRTVVVALAAASLVLGIGGAAQAAQTWNHTDGFDSAPQGTWSFVGTGGFHLNQGTAFTPANNAWVSATSGWSSVGKNLTLPATGGGWIKCDSTIFVRAPSGARVNLEIINPADWNYVALLQATLSPSTSYQPLVINDWNGGSGRVFIRVALIGEGTTKTIRVDHMFVHCDFVVIE
jgi:hypothetical protein